MPEYSGPRLLLVAGPVNESCRFDLPRHELAVEAPDEIGHLKPGGVADALK
jgi:hypothetical protein